MDTNFSVLLRSRELAERLVQTGVLDKKDLPKYAPAFAMRPFDWKKYDRAVDEKRVVPFLRQWKDDASQWLVNLRTVSQVAIRLIKEESSSDAKKEIQKPVDLDVTSMESSDAKEKIQKPVDLDVTLMESSDAKENIQKPVGILDKKEEYERKRRKRKATGYVSDDKKKHPRFDPRLDSKMALINLG